MKTLLVITRDAGFAGSIGAGLDPQLWKIRHAAGAPAAIGQTGPSTVDAVLLDDRAGRLATDAELIRQAFPNVPVIAALDQPGDCNTALSSGATVAFTKPLRSGLLQAWLDHQLAPRESNRPSNTTTASPAPLTEKSLAALDSVAGLASIVSQNLEPAALTREFLLHLREIVGCNRCAVYVRNEDPDNAGFDCAHAIGRPAATVSTTTLRLASGIGAELNFNGRVLRRENATPDARREFAEIGAEVAIPILDRENLVGIALLDSRITGASFTDQELVQIFKALETFGIALSRARHHAALAAAESMSTGVLDTLETACCVVGSNLKLLHANPAARQIFSLTDDSGIHDLPAVLVSKIFTALRDRAEQARFRHTTTDGAGRVLEVGIRPIPHPLSDGLHAVLLAAEDVTSIEQSRREQADSASRRFIRSMAEHFAHEIGNTLVPLSTGQQLMASGEVDAEMMQGLEGVFSSSVRRIERLAGQMQYLSREGLQNIAAVPLAETIGNAFEDARKRAGAANATLDLQGVTEADVVRGERKALRQAFGEILLNALQSNGEDPKVRVIARRAGDAFEIDIHDDGVGFSAAEREHATEPFYSNRTVGMGLGLAVTRQIIELHEGRLDIQPSATDSGGCVRLCLPLAD
jgi:signal transduction histidine kinase/DNA-binding response OmpR family regulator